VVTSNHNHLVVHDEGGGHIPKSIQLLAGRTGQEYNQRKKRTGAFWEDRYVPCHSHRDRRASVALSCVRGPQHGPALSDDETNREDRWTRSAATGSRSFVEDVKARMHSFAIGRHVREGAKGFELRELQLPYRALFGTEKSHMDIENLQIWDE
jgi:putative transposase